MGGTSEDVGDGPRENKGNDPGCASKYLPTRMGRTISEGGVKTAPDPDDDVDSGEEEYSSTMTGSKDEAKNCLKLRQPAGELWH